MKHASLLELIAGAEEIAQDNCTFETLDNVHASDRAGYDAFRKYGAKFRTKEGRIDSVVLMGDRLETIPESEFSLFPDYFAFLQAFKNKSYSQIKLSRVLYRLMREGKAYDFLLNGIDNPVKRETSRKTYEGVANGSIPVTFSIPVRGKCLIKPELQKTKSGYFFTLWDNAQTLDNAQKSSYELTKHLDAAERSLARAKKKLGDAEKRINPA